MQASIDIEPAKADALLCAYYENFINEVNLAMEDWGFKNEETRRHVLLAMLVQHGVRYGLDALEKTIRSGWDGAVKGINAPVPAKH
jgi:hypothetical protein